MSRLDPEKLHVEYVGTTPTEPVIPRRHTIIRSGAADNLYLTIGLDFAFNKFTPAREEILGEWIVNGESYEYNVFLFINGRYSEDAKAEREAAFRNELPVALEAIRYGDAEFFEAHPELDNVPIVVYFLSTDPAFNKVENWGTFSDYKTSDS